jgi:hypothetical protein
MCFSLLIVPARADVVTEYSQSPFSQFVVETLCYAGGAKIGASIGCVGGPLGALIGAAVGAGITTAAAWYAAGHTDQEVYDAMNEYTTGLQTDLGSTVLVNGGYRRYMICSDCGTPGGYPVPSYISLVYNPLKVIGSSGSANRFQFTFGSYDYISLPFAATLSWGYDLKGISSVYSASGPGNRAVGTQWSVSANSNFQALAYVTVDAPASFSIGGTCFLVVKPTTTVSDCTTRDVTPASRCGSITNVCYQSVSGDTYENCTIVNETSNTLQLPGSDTTITYTDWNYDYTTRTYQLTAEGGTVYNITYGDEYLTISDGTTSTNYYYAIKNNTGTGTGGDSGTSTDYTGLLNTIIEKIEAVIAKLDTLATGTVTNIENVTTNITNTNNAYNVFYVTDEDGNQESVASVAGSSISVIGKLFNFLYKAVFKGAITDSGTGLGNLSDFYLNTGEGSANLWGS